MPGELETIRSQFSQATCSLTELFKAVMMSQNELYEKGKCDAYLEMLQFCRQHCDKDGRIDKEKLQEFIQKKIQEVQTK